MVETSTKKTDDIYEIIVSGEIDASSSIHLDNELENAFKQKEENILMNLTDLKYISSAGLGVFIARLEEVKENNVKLVFCGLQDNVKQVFNLLGLEEILTIASDREVAMGHFA